MNEMGKLRGWREQVGIYENRGLGGYGDGDWEWKRWIGRWRDICVERHMCGEGRGRWRWWREQVGS